MQGLPVEVDGKVIEPASMLKPPIRGHRIAIMGDTYDSQKLECLLHTLVEQKKISEIILDVLVHEATLEDGMFEEALKKGHSTPSHAVKLASRLNVRLLVLTHFSHRYAAFDQGLQLAGGKLTLDVIKSLTIDNFKCGYCYNLIGNN